MNTLDQLRVIRQNVQSVQDVYDQANQTINGYRNDIWFTLFESIEKDIDSHMSCLSKGFTESYHHLFEENYRPYHIETCRMVLREMQTTINTLARLLSFCDQKYKNTPWLSPPPEHTRTTCSRSFLYNRPKNIAQSIRKIEEHYGREVFSYEDICKSLQHDGKRHYPFAVVALDERDDAVAYATCDLLRYDKTPIPTVTSFGVTNIGMNRDASMNMAEEIAQYMLQEEVHIEHPKEIRHGTVHMSLRENVTNGVSMRK